MARQRQKQKQSSLNCGGVVISCGDVETELLEA